mgnify:CR=1 FL=1
MRLLVSWLRDFVPIDRPASDIAERLALRGFEVASVEPLGSDDGVIDFERPTLDVRTGGLKPEMKPSTSLPTPGDEIDIRPGLALASASRTRPV